MTNEFYQVSYKRFTSENEDGTGKRFILDEKSEMVNIESGTKKAQQVKAAYRNLKKELS